jgi:hypothetical protein
MARSYGAAGTTRQENKFQLFSRHSGRVLSRNPVGSKLAPHSWIPAFAGMTI